MSSLKVFAAFLSLGLIMLFIVKNEDGFNNSLACTKLEEFRDQDYSGVVVRKYLDEKNHQFRTIELNRKASIILVRDTSSFYSFVQEGDSIVKRKGTESLMLYRKNEIRDFIFSIMDVSKTFD